MKKYIILFLLAGLQADGLSAAESKDDNRSMQFDITVLPKKIQEGLQLTALDIYEIAEEQAFDLLGYFNGDCGEDNAIRFTDFIEAAELAIINAFVEQGIMQRFADLLVVSIQSNSPLQIGDDLALHYIVDIAHAGLLARRYAHSQWYDRMINILNEYRFTCHRTDQYPCNTLLTKAMYQKQDDIASWLIDLGVDIHACHISGFTPLHFAASQGELRLIKKLLDAGAGIEAEWARENDNSRFVSVQKQRSGGITPLHCTIMNNQKDAATLLLTKGANLHALAHFYYHEVVRTLQPLLLAVACKQPEMVQFLIEKGCSVNEPELNHPYSSEPNSLFFALRYALTADNEYVNEWFKDNEHGDPYVITSRDDTNIIDDLLLQIIDLLCRNGVNIGIIDDDGFSALDLVLKNFVHGYPLSLVKKLLHYGFQMPRISFNEMKAALVRSYSDVDVQEKIDFLLQHGANIRERDDHGNSLLFEAVDRPELLDYLITKGLDPFARNDRGQTLFHQAAAHRCSFRSMQHLQAIGLDINEPDNDGITPIMASMLDYNIKPEEFFNLLSLGAKLDIETIPDALWKDMTSRYAWFESLDSIQKLLDLNINPAAITIPGYPVALGRQVQALVDAARPRYAQRRAQIAEQNAMDVQDYNVAQIQPAVSNHLMSASASVSSTVVMPAASAIQLAAVPAVIIPGGPRTREELRAAATQAAEERQKKAAGK